MLRGPNKTTRKTETCLQDSVNIRLPLLTAQLSNDCDHGNQGCGRDNDNRNEGRAPVASNT